MQSNLLELPRSVLGVLLEFTDHRSLHQLEATCCHASATITATCVWRTTAHKHIALHPSYGDTTAACGTDIDAGAAALHPHASSVDWKRMACIATMPCARNQRLLRDVHACSSVDRPGESPSNTLVPSHCWLSMQTLADCTQSLRLHDDSDAVCTADAIALHRSAHTNALESFAEVAQIECGCETTACYWSSAPSTRQATRDFIEYTTTKRACVIASVHVLPYRAFWHPDSPTFAPQHVSFEFFIQRQSNSDAGSVTDNSSSNSSTSRNSSTSSTSSSSSSSSSCDSEPDAHSNRVRIYASPIYTMANVMQLHAFELPKRVYLPRGCNATFRLNLIGRHQREAFEMPPWIPSDEQEPAESPYYCCLSYVAIVGAIVCDTH